MTTMSRNDLISRQEVVKLVTGKFFTSLSAEERGDAIRDLPSAQSERKKGKWIDKGGYIECSNCGCLAPSVEFADKVLWKKSSFCPDCGARMAQEGEDNGKAD